MIFISFEKAYTTSY